MCRWMGSYFHDWIDYNNGVTFSIELLEWGQHIFGFFGGRKFFIFTVSKCTRMFVLQVKSIKVFFIQSKKWANS